RHAGALLAGLGAAGEDGCAQRNGGADTPGTYTQQGTHIDVILINVASHGATGIVTWHVRINRTADGGRLAETAASRCPVTASCGIRLFHPGAPGYDGPVIWSSPNFKRAK
ncbi:MAG TPA: hypothetical protein VGH49_11660, partial [Xanthobacteraceae bacterium]